MSAVPLDPIKPSSIPSIPTEEKLKYEIVHLCDPISPKEPIQYKEEISSLISMFNDAYDDEHLLTFISNLLLECITNLPHKTYIYVAFFCQLAETKEEYVNTFYLQNIKYIYEYWNHIGEQEIQFRLLIRFYALSTCYHMISFETLESCFKILLAFIESEEHSSIYKDLLVYSILSSIVWCGNSIPETLISSLYPLLAPYMDSRPSLRYDHLSIFNTSKDEDSLVDIYTYIYKQDNPSFENTYIPSNIYTDIYAEQPPKDLDIQILTSLSTPLSSPVRLPTLYLSQYIYFPSIPINSIPVDISPIEKHVLKQLIKDLSICFHPSFSTLPSLFLYLRPTQEHLYYIAETLVCLCLSRDPIPTTQASIPAVISPLYYMNILIELAKCTLQGEPVKKYIGRCINNCFLSLSSLYTPALYRLSLFFALYLNNDNLLWPWEKWESQITPNSVQYTFIYHVLLLLSYGSNISTMRNSISRGILNYLPRLREEHDNYEQLGVDRNYKSLHTTLSDPSMTPIVAQSALKMYMTNNPLKPALFLGMLLNFVLDRYELLVPIKTTMELVSQTIKTISRQIPNEDPAEVVPSISLYVSPSSVPYIYIDTIFNYYSKDYISLYKCLNEFFSEGYISFPCFISYIYLHPDLIKQLEGWYIIKYVFKNNINTQEDVTKYCHEFITFVFYQLNKYNDITFTFVSQCFEDFYKEVYAIIPDKQSLAMSICSLDIKDTVMSYYEYINEL